MRPLCHPYADLACGNYTDHFSDMNTARMFTHAGLDIWRKPLGELGEPMSGAETAALPDDLRTTLKEGSRKVPGWPEDKPYVATFVRNPSFQPPGGLALTAPVAAIYSYTSLSFSDANRLLIALYLVYAHVSLYVFFRAAARMGAGAVGFLGAFVVYGEVIHLTLQGFYEAALIGPLILSAWAAYERRGLAATAWFVIAVAIHFRALFFLPVFLYGCYLLVRQREWRKWSPRAWSAVVGAGAAGAATLVAFLYLWPHLTSMEVTAPVYFRKLFDDPPDAIFYSGIALLLGAVLAVARGWRDLVLLVWGMGMFTLLREAFAWDVLTMLAWIGMPVVATRAGLVRDVRLVAVMFVALVVFNNQSFPMPIWLRDVI
ncbi:MAG: hypothetical protein ACRDI3_03760 [Actinomycetota bacterium]